MAAAEAFSTGAISLDVMVADHPGLVEQLCSFDPLKIAAAFAALLTVPELQSNCVRLEALVQLGLAIGKGARKPLTKHLARWFAALGAGRCGLAEDPAEDVFVGLIATPRGNFRVLDGIWESGTFYLQRVVVGLFAGGFSRMAAQAGYALVDGGCERPPWQGVQCNRCTTVGRTRMEG